MGSFLLQEKRGTLQAYKPVAKRKGYIDPDVPPGLHIKLLRSTIGERNPNLV